MSTIFKMQRVEHWRLSRSLPMLQVWRHFYRQKSLPMLHVRRHFYLQHQNERIRRVGSLYNMQSW